MTAVALRAPRAAVAVHPLTRAAVKAAVRQGLDSLRADPPQRYSDWATDHFELTGESSHQKGAWEVWPFQVGWMDAFSNDDIEHVDVQKSKRVGYTKTVVGFMAYNIAHRRRKQAVWQPTDDDRDSFVKSEIEPAFAAIPAIAKAKKAGKGAEDTIKLKTYRDSVAHFLGGKAARSYRRITVAVAILDEWSGFDQQVEKSSDPGTLARGRLEGAPHPKFIGGSTPRVKGLCHVERSRLNAQADMRYNIRCPHCKEEHALMWGGKDVTYGFKWDKGRPETVRHVCPHCACEIRQADYLANWVGAWVCIKTGIRYGADQVWRNAAGHPIRPPKHVAFQIWAAYSPQRTWADIVDERLKAQAAYRAGDHGPLQGWTNETAGETWEVMGERVEEHALQARAEPFPLGVVPVGGVHLTAGIDLQGNRWEIGIWAWGRGLESWPVDHCIIEGNPARDEDWAPVELYLQRRFKQAWHGGTLGISSISVDSGHHTHAVYNWARKMLGRMKVHVIKGSSEEGKPIKGTASSQEIKWDGKRWPNGVKVWLIGTDTAKDLLHGQLQIAVPGPGYVHFSQQLPREWYEQLTAEQRIPVRTPTGESYRWVKRRPRNEVLDTRNYAVHAAFMDGLERYTPRDWDRLEAAVQPPRDLFSAPEVAVAAQVAAAGPGAAGSGADDHGAAQSQDLPPDEQAPADVPAPAPAQAEPAHKGPVKSLAAPAPDEPEAPAAPATPKPEPQQQPPQAARSYVPRRWR
jgi:phage terminase large subunit GpA-like protein